MHTKSTLSRSIKKFIRLQKSRIRSLAADPASVKEGIQKLYQQFENYGTKSNSSESSK